PAIPITDQAGEAGAIFFSASANGVVAYRPNRAAGDSELTWFNRDGKLLSTALKPGLVDVALSPDGARVAGSSSEVPFTTILGRGMPSRGGRGIASGRSS